MEKRYRVTNADGSECYECRGRTFPSLEYALRVCAGHDDNAEALGGAPHRVQELVEEWRDVPVPEPLPDLPDTEQIERQLNEVRADMFDLDADRYEARFSELRARECRLQAQLLRAQAVR